MGKLFLLAASLSIFMGAPAMNNSKIQNTQVTPIVLMANSLDESMDDTEVIEVVEEDTTEETDSSSETQTETSNDTVVEDFPNIDSEENINQTVENLKELIEALKDELSATKFNANNLAKILISLAGSLGSLMLILLWRLLRTKLLNLKKDEEYQKAKEEMERQFKQYQDDVKDQLASLETKVVKKIDDTETQRKKEAEAESIKLKESVATAKKNLEINKILDE